MNTIKIIIDSNENAKFQNKLSENGLNFNVDVLPLGDIIFEKENKIVVLIERKTWSDLEASICDGRKDDQIWRLRQFSDKNPSVRVCYLLEKNEHRGKIKIQTLIQSIVNIMIRDNIHIITTSGMNGTYKHLCKIKKSLLKYDTINTGKTRSESLSKCNKKSSSITPSVWLKCALASIPMIGIKNATKICDSYPTIQQLILAISNDSISIRGIGPKKINYIKTYLCI